MMIKIKKYSYKIIGRNENMKIWIYSEKVKDRKELDIVLQMLFFTGQVNVKKLLKKKKLPKNILV